MQAEDSGNTTYLEYHDAKSSKFWKLELRGNSTFVTYGKVGTSGSDRNGTKHHASAVAAAAFREKMVREKLKKGYIPANGPTNNTTHMPAGTGSSSGASAGAAPAVAAPAGAEQEQEQEQEQGDPQQAALHRSLEAFLAGINLSKHLAVLEVLGYDDVEDYRNMDDAALQEFEDELKRKGVPAGHVGKLSRAVKAERSKVALGTGGGAGAAAPAGAQQEQGAAGPGALPQLLAMGFPEDAARRAVARYGPDVDAAADWLLNQAAAGPAGVPEGGASSPQAGETAAPQNMHDTGFELVLPPVTARQEHEVDDDEDDEDAAFWRAAEQAVASDQQFRPPVQSDTSAPQGREPAPRTPIACTEAAAIGRNEEDEDPGWNVKHCQEGNTQGPKRKAAPSVDAISAPARAAHPSETGATEDPPAKRQRKAAHKEPVRTANEDGDAEDDAFWREAEQAFSSGQPFRRGTQGEQAGPSTSPAPGAADGQVDGVIADGATVQVQGSGSTTYTVKRAGPVLSCTCPAWKFQKGPVNQRTCKHLRQLLGDEAEQTRVRDNGGSAQPSARCSSTAGPSNAEGPGDSAKPGVLLAKALTGEEDVDGWWMSEKLDGLRAVWTGSELLSRTGKRFAAPASFCDALPRDLRLDGELWCGRGPQNFSLAQSIVRSAGAANDARWTAVKYVVFDAPDMPGVPFEQRLAHVRATLEPRKLDHVEVLHHQICADRGVLHAELARVVGIGGEGLMLRQPGSMYISARSSTLLKVKEFHDMEATVIGYKNGKGKHEGVVGSLHCELNTGVTFYVGSGLSEAERAAPPPIGATITFRYFEMSTDGVPRFPTFLRIRPSAD